MTEPPPRRRRLLRLLVAGGALLLLCAGATLAAASWLGVFRPDATQRLRRHFDLADASSPDRIDDGLAARLPAGTPEAEVVAFLKRCGIGKDSLSGIHPDPKGGTIVCRIELDPESFGVVKESYGIVFHFDAARRLVDIQVLRWLTGP